MVSPLCVFYFSLPCFYQRPSCHAERHETIFAGAVLYADYVVVRWIVLQTMVRTLQMLEGLQMNKKAQFQGKVSKKNVGLQIPSEEDDIKENVQMRDYRFHDEKMISWKM